MYKKSLYKHIEFHMHKNIFLCNKVSWTSSIDFFRRPTITASTCLHRFRPNPVSEWILMMKSFNWISAKSIMSSAHSWEIWLRSNNGISLIKIHSLTVFFLSCDLLFQYISSGIVYFYLKYYELFFIVKVEGVPSQQLKCSISLPNDVKVNTHCYETMGRWCCLGN